MKEIKGTVTAYGLEMTSDRLPSIVCERTYETETEVFLNPKVVDEFFRTSLRLEKQCEEHLYMITLNGRGRAQGLFELSHGTMNQTFCGAKELAIRMLLSGASDVILTHNHPGGDLSPSIQDERIVDRINEIANLLDIKLLDFIIIGETGFYSFAEHEKI